MVSVKGKRAGKHPAVWEGTQIPSSKWRRVSDPIVNDMPVHHQLPLGGCAKVDRL